MPSPTTTNSWRSAGVPIAFAFDSSHRDGYTVGAGLEYMFAQNWSAKLEYQFYDFGSSRFIAPAALIPLGSFRTEDHTVKAGLNYRFNLGRPDGGEVLITSVECGKRPASSRRPFYFDTKSGEFSGPSARQLRMPCPCSWPPGYGRSLGGNRELAQRQHRGCCVVPPSVRRPRANGFRSR